MKELNRLLEIIADIAGGRYSNEVMELTGPGAAEPIRTIAEAMGLMMVKIEAREYHLEVLIKQKFRKQIRSNQYEFLFAYNGKEALEKLEQHPDTDLVLSDINMPEMDGLTLLSKLHEMNPLLKAVIVSAYGDMDNIRTAMNRGAFDFVTKPINFEDLTITMEKTLEHVRHIRDTLRAVKQRYPRREFVWLMG